MDLYKLQKELIKQALSLDINSHSLTLNNTYKIAYSLVKNENRRYFFSIIIMHWKQLVDLLKNL